jgi:hypothetical protein
MFYRAHGLLIGSDVPLPLPVSAPGVPDLTLSLAAAREVPNERPPGERLAETARPDLTLFYTLTRTPTSVILRYPGLCDFVGDASFSTIAVHVHPGADEGLLPVLIAGGLLATHLMLRHELVLHASAIRAGDVAVAFVGRSGMGKSTLATALCADGYPLISDDLLRVGPDLVVHPGATETRLRPSARALSNDHSYETADGRLATRPGTLETSPLPLAACVIPGPSRAATRVSTHRLRPVEALVRLSSYPRILGWTDPTTMAAAFQSLADLVERVPVVEATIPWGLPFAPGTLTELMASLAEDCPARSA